MQLSVTSLPETTTNFCGVLYAVPLDACDVQSQAEQLRPYGTGFIMRPWKPGKVREVENDPQK